MDFGSGHRDRRGGIIMFADYHIHTEFSDDSDYPMEEAVKDAVRMGLEEICFTDHVDYGIKRDSDDPRGILCRNGGPGGPGQTELKNVDYPEYYAQIKKLQDQYRGQITLKMGLEFGMEISTVPEYEALYQKYPFDFIILSVHQINGKEFWTQEFQKGYTQKQYNDRYYEEILALVRRYHDYSVLGHLDLISRYDLAGHYPFEKIRPVITEILKTVIADGKGIEVNTSSHRYRLRDLTPSRDILKLYKKLGGEILTIGSDCHRKEHLGAYIKEVKQELRDMGYTRFCTFDRMMPVFHNL